MLNTARVINTYGSSDMHIFCKHEDRYLDASTDFITLSGCHSKQDFVGCTDSELAWKEFSAKYQADDSFVQLTQTPLVAIELFNTIKYRLQTVMVVKLPIVEADKMLVLGITTVISKCKWENYLSSIIDISKNISPKLAMLVKVSLLYHLEINEPKVLTEREIQCLHYYTLGYSAREVAAILEIKSRTVEQHIANVKIKLDCRTKTELINKVLTNPELLK